MNRLKATVLFLLIISLLLSINFVKSPASIGEPVVVGNITANTTNGDIPIEDAIVQGLDENNNVISETKTNYRGIYIFTNKKVKMVKVSDIGHKTEYAHNVYREMNLTELRDISICLDDECKETRSSIKDNVLQTQIDTKEKKRIVGENGKVDINFNYSRVAYITDQLDKSIIMNKNKYNRRHLGTTYGGQALKIIITNEYVNLSQTSPELKAQHSFNMSYNEKEKLIYFDSDEQYIYAKPLYSKDKEYKGYDGLLNRYYI